jgi:predicted nucleic acid-binding protein
MRVYLDNCCYNRPFDDLSQDRIFLEAEAVLTIISRCERGLWTLVTSGVVEYEALRISDTDKLVQVRAFFDAADERVLLSDEAESRAMYFRQNGIRNFDSLHLAVAEMDGVDVFLTTDDKLLRAAQRIDLKILTANPVTWLMEVLKNEQYSH